MCAASAAEPNELRDLLYNIGRQEVPEYVWHWFFRYFAAGSSVFQAEPQDLLHNYQALIIMAKELLKHKYSSGHYAKFIKDSGTPDYTYYFVGDTHGSFGDTYQMIDYFIRVFQVNPKVKVVWIGDMVDRNPYDLQNLAFILAFWIMFPNNVFIVRGNHEDSSVCSRYGFSQHLYEKAGSKQMFTPIWEQIIDFFSKLPIGMYCRVGDRNVFVVHAGIPFDVDNYRPIRLADIENTLNCYKAEHFDMDVFSQTMLWADPDPELPEIVAPNPRTGRPRFSTQAFREFMDLNGFDLLIRGHEKWENGYHLFFNNQLVSLFSTSTYDSRKIGEAKFMRLQPTTEIADIGDEQLGFGKGILNVDSVFLEKQLSLYYGAKNQSG
jgi:predicted phosphodiesterase